MLLKKRDRSAISYDVI